MYLTDSLLTGLAASPTIVLPVRLAPMKAAIPSAAATANPHTQRSSGPAQLASSSGRLRTSVACQASLSRADFGGPQGDSRRLLKYVRDVSPNEVQVFIEQSPPAVVAAFKQTVANMVGTLPPQHFSVTIDTVADSLAQLMQTMLRTGYLLHNVKYQMELEMALRGAAASMSAPEHTSSLQGAASSPSVLADSIDAADGPGLSLPGTASTPIGSLSAASAIEPEIVSSTTDEDSASLMATSPATSSSTTSMMVGAWAHADDEYAPGVQCKVDGHVLRWHPTHGVERMAAQQYIQMLEDRVKALEQQLQQQQGALPASQPPLPLPQASAPPTYSLPVSTSFASEALSPHHTSPGMAAAAAASAAAAAAFGGYAAAGGAGPHAAGHTDLLSYLRTLDATALSSLADCGQDVADAMQAFVARLMGTHERDQLRAMTSEFTAVELSKLLLWLLVVGWSLRALEVRSSWFEEEPGGAAEPLGAALYGGAATRSGDGEGPPGTSPWSW